LAREASQLASEVEAAVSALLTPRQRLVGLLRPWTRPHTPLQPLPPPPSTTETWSRVGVD
jgi:hypothetical protein